MVISRGENDADDPRGAEAYMPNGAAVPRKTIWIVRICANETFCHLVKLNGPVTRRPTAARFGENAWPKPG